MEKEYIFGMMEKDMKVIGKMIKNKEREYIIIKKVIDMKAIIKMIKKNEKEYIIIKMVIDMKMIGKMVKEKEKEYFIVIMCDREIGDYINNSPIGKFAILHVNGELTSTFYN